VNGIVIRGDARSRNLQQAAKLGLWPRSTFEIQPRLIGLFTNGAVPIQLETRNAVCLGLSARHTKAFFLSPTLDPFPEKRVAGFFHGSSKKMILS
jgi:hypothetical protein